MKDSNVGRYMRLFDRVLSVVEKECILKGNDDFVAVLYNKIEGYEAKTLQKVFSLVADISLKDYIRRRRLTETYHKITNFEAEKKTRTINGIRSAKAKIIKEFGSKPSGLQEYLYDEFRREVLWDRLKWKLKNKITKRCVVPEDELIVFSVNALPYSIDDTYFIWRGNYFRFIGGKIEEKKEKNEFLSLLFGKDVFDLHNVCGSAETALGLIFRFMKGEKPNKEEAMMVRINTYRYQGFTYENLVSEISGEEGIIIEMDISKTLHIKDDKLVMDLREYYVNI